MPTANGVEENVLALIRSGDLQDAVADLTEAGIDQLLKDGFLRDVPIFGSVMGVIRVAGSVRDLLLAKKLGRKSLLDRDSIEYLLKGDTLRMSHGWTETHLTETPRETVEFWVLSADANRARLLLRELAAEMPGPGDFNSEQPGR
jgi:hypothetical protein